MTSLKKKISKQRYYQTPGYKLLQKKRHIKRKYNLSLEEVTALWTAQGNKCAICKIEKEKVSTNNGLHIDHCHTTGKVRGLLCGNCNRGLGMFEDSPELLQSAINYLL